MKKPMCTLALIMALVVGSNALAVVTLPEDDLNPAPFREGPGWTLQAWYWDTPETGVSPADAEVDLNDYGTAVAEITVNGSAAWMPEYLGQTGVFEVDHSELSDLIIRVPNVPQENYEKHVWVQMVFYADTGHAPNLYVIPEGDYSAYQVMTKVAEQAVDDNYLHVTYSLTLDFNPEWEYVFIRPGDCEMFVDSVIVETQCIPEPMSMVVLGLGSLLLRLRRKQ